MALGTASPFQGRSGQAHVLSLGCSLQLNSSRFSSGSWEVARAPGKEQGGEHARFFTDEALGTGTLPGDGQGH